MADDLTDDIAATLRKIWWLPVLRGVVLLILGLLMLIEPLQTLTALVWVFGAFAVLDGILTLAIGFANRHEPGAGWWFLQGVAGIAFGLVIMFWPSATVSVLFFLLALWVLVLGVLGIIASISLYRARSVGWSWMLTFGLIGTLFGLVLLMNPQTSISVIVVVYGLFAFVGGVVLIVSGFATRSEAERLEAQSKVVEA